MGFLEGYIYGNQISMSGRLADQEDEIDNVSKKLDSLMTENREKIFELQDKLRKAERERNYWKARSKALSDVLEKTNPGDSVYDKIHADYISSLAKEEMLIKTEDNREISNEIARIDFSAPAPAISCFQEVYGPAFPEVLNRPQLTTNEPYWKQYVWMVMDRSAQDREWVEKVVEGTLNRLSEISERTKIAENLKNLSFHYMNAVFYDGDVGTQSVIRTIMENEDIRRTNWNEFSKETSESIRKILPENIGADEKTMDQESRSWIKSARLYLKKYEAIERGELLRYPTLETGFRPKTDADNIPIPRPLD